MKEVRVGKQTTERHDPSDVGKSSQDEGPGRVASGSCGSSEGTRLTGAERHPPRSPTG